MEQGRIPEACQKFAESLALARRGGTLLNLALCRAKEGKSATAMRLLAEARDVANRDGRADRATLAAEGLEAVRARLSWLTLRPAAGPETPGLTLFCDGEALAPGAWGTLQAVDPGRHVVAATAPGRVRFEATVSIGESSDDQIVEIPLLAADPPAPSRTAAGKKPEATTTAIAPVDWRVPVGWASVGVGVAALAAGSVLGLGAINDAADSKTMCPETTCPLDAYTKNEHARTEAIASDVAIPVGVASVGVGLYLLLRHRSIQAPSGRARVVPIARPGAAGLTLQGAW